MPFPFHRHHQRATKPRRTTRPWQERCGFTEREQREWDLFLAGWDDDTAEQEPDEPRQWFWPVICAAIGLAAIAVGLAIANHIQP